MLIQFFGAGLNLTSKNNTSLASNAVLAWIPCDVPLENVHFLGFTKNRESALNHKILTRKYWKLN